MDETSFHLLEAVGADAVEEAANRAGIDPLRIVAAEEHIARRVERAAPGTPTR